MTGETVRTRARHHAALGFIRGLEDAAATEFTAGLDAAVEAGHVSVEGDAARLWVRPLPWDSRHFGHPTLRIDFADWGEDVTDPRRAVSVVARDVLSGLARQYDRFYLFAEVPSEDVALLQGLGEAGLSLVETRLTYVHDTLETVDVGAQAATRAATVADIPNLRTTAAEARNAFDRYHADPFYGQASADAYLAEYVAQCVAGFSDVVLVPGDDAPAGAFVCGKADIDAPGGARVGRLQLAAVSAPRRGWYRPLGAALLAWMRERGVTCVLNTTQSTNRAVIHVSEQLGYRYGRATHVLAFGHDGEQQR